MVGFVQTSDPPGKATSYKLTKPGPRGFSRNAGYFAPSVFLSLCLKNVNLEEKKRVHARVGQIPAQKQRGKYEIQLSAQTATPLNVCFRNILLLN